VYDADVIMLSVGDDGVGLDTDKLSSSSGHGLRHMRKTAEELGGDLEIHSASWEGITVVLTLLLQEEWHETTENNDR
jgi:signal transduction histidine kinase